ncbi:hypothetical protein CR513_06445, partial [Mucuna pruriens]
MSLPLVVLRPPSLRILYITCFIYSYPLIILFDSKVTNSFILHDCMSFLKLPVSSLKCDLIVDTPTNGLVTTSSVCLQCPLTIHNRKFLVDDLMCLPLTNHVLINCLDTSIVFGKPVLAKDERSKNLGNFKLHIVEHAHAHEEQPEEDTNLSGKITASLRPTQYENPNGRDRFHGLGQKIQAKVSHNPFGMPFIKLALDPQIFKRFMIIVDHKLLRKK